MGSDTPILTTATPNLSQHHLFKNPSRRVSTLSRAVQSQQARLNATLKQLADTHVLLKSLYAAYSIPDSATAAKSDTGSKLFSSSPPIIKSRTRRELDAILAYTHHLESRAQVEQRELARLEAKLHGAQVDQAFWGLRFPPKEGRPAVKQVKKFLRELLRRQEAGKEECGGIDAAFEENADTNSDASTLVEETFGHLEAASLSEEAAGAAARFAAAAAELSAATDKTSDVAVKKKPIPSRVKMSTVPIMVVWQASGKPDMKRNSVLRKSRSKTAVEKAELKKIVEASSTEVKNEQSCEASKFDTAKDGVQAPVAETQDAKSWAEKDVDAKAESKAEAPKAESPDAPFSAVITTFAIGVTIALLIVLPLALSASGWEHRGARMRYY